jgi:hypothetical protein
VSHDPSCGLSARSVGAVERLRFSEVRRDVALLRSARMEDPRVEIVKFMVDKKLECLHLAARLPPQDPTKILTTAKTFYAWLNELAETEQSAWRADNKAP